MSLEISSEIISADSRRHLRCANRQLLAVSRYAGQLSLAIPPRVGTMSTGQRAVMLCDWGVKADMVLFAGNTG